MPRRTGERPAMLDLLLAAFVGGLLLLGLRRPFIWVLAYVYIDIVAPQKISWFLLKSVPISLILFVAAFGGWMIADSKQGSRFTFRQMLILCLLFICGMTTLTADYPVEAALKWEWVWKSLVFAIFLPLTLRTRLRIEAAALFMVLSAGAIIISAGVKTVLSGGGGYGSLQSFVSDNTGLYEGSTISMVAIAIIPLVLWLARHGTVFARGWMVTLFRRSAGGHLPADPGRHADPHRPVVHRPAGGADAAQRQAAVPLCGGGRHCPARRHPVPARQLHQAHVDDRGPPGRHVGFDPRRSVEMDLRVRPRPSVRRRLRRLYRQLGALRDAEVANRRQHHRGPVDRRRGQGPGLSFGLLRSARRAGLAGADRLAAVAGDRHIPARGPAPAAETQDR